MALTKVSYSMIDGAVLNALDFGAVGDGVADDSSAIQAALDAITANTTLYFPAGTYKVTQSLTITSKSNFNIVMDGVVVPNLNLAPATNILFNLTTCTNFYIKPNIVNASYGYTLDCFRLTTCSYGKIADGIIDVKYASIDGTAGIQIRNDTNHINIAHNKIRTGYGVLVNDALNVNSINIESNEFLGQVAYGNTGPGDAVEFNSPTNPSSSIRVVNNTFSNFAPVLSPQRYLVTGFANVQGLIVEGNTFNDIAGMIAIHLEDGTSYARVSNNEIQTAHMGVHLVINTTKNLIDLAVTDNTIKQPVISVAATYDTDFGIVLQTNQLAGGGQCLGLVVSGNTVSTTSTARYGIVIFDHRKGVISNNQVDGFQITNIQVTPANAFSTGIFDSVISNNVSTGAAFADKYKISRGAPNSTYVDDNIFRNVSVTGNIATSDSGVQPVNDYYVANISANTQPSVRKFVNGKTVATNNTATTAFTLSVTNNAQTQGMLLVKYTVTLTGANRVVETGQYAFAFGRVSGANLQIAAASKTNNAQVAVNGSGTITVSMAAGAVSGAASATNTVPIQWTCVDGTANSPAAGSECVFEVEMITSGGIGGGTASII
jgi:hypothetical protein